MNGVATTMQLPVTVESGVSLRSKVVYGGVLEFYCLFTFRVVNMGVTYFSRSVSGIWAVHIWVW